jgi:hypothetical protein
MPRPATDDVERVGHRGATSAAGGDAPHPRVAGWAVACSSDDAGEGSTSATTGTKGGDPLLVTTDLGDVQGVDSAVEGVRAFHAVPYAAEPSGDNRWRAPQPRDRYDGTLDATTPGAMCPQSTAAVDFLETTPNEQAEDCLTVSVWSPTGAADLPVMVWFHGGSLISGSGEQVLFAGDDLAANGVVVVTVNTMLRRVLGKRPRCLRSRGCTDRPNSPLISMEPESWLGSPTF